ncbi:hypothetical protein HMN09_00808200 [Mycena chlorophos]|uniref:Uncharacterized protein n=1 Tax=Mycena chlorophos TaxID=658473 RepID=A0A8H6W8H6_MYCCL|nr:hypothetical protein HMN09_00808200 [Mycena chlorophos]
MDALLTVLLLLAVSAIVLNTIYHRLEASLPDEDTQIVRLERLVDPTLGVIAHQKEESRRVHQVASCPHDALARIATKLTDLTKRAKDAESLLAIRDKRVQAMSGLYSEERTAKEKLEGRVRELRVAQQKMQREHKKEMDAAVLRLAAETEKRLLDAAALEAQHLKDVESLEEIMVAEFVEKDKKRTRAHTQERKRLMDKCKMLWKKVMELEMDATAAMGREWCEREQTDAFIARLVVRAESAERAGQDERAAREQVAKTAEATIKDLKNRLLVTSNERDELREDLASVQQVGTVIAAKVELALRSHRRKSTTRRLGHRSSGRATQAPKMVQPTAPANEDDFDEDDHVLDLFSPAVNPVQVRITPIPHHRGRKSLYEKVPDVKVLTRYAPTPAPAPAPASIPQVGPPASAASQFASNAAKATTSAGTVSQSVSADSLDDAHELQMFVSGYYNA